MRKSVSKRIKITGTGKLIHRKPGKNHFNAKHSRRVQLRQKGMMGFTRVMEKKMKRYL